MLFHKGNVKASIPIGQSVHLRETYDNVDILLQAIQYEAHQWYICADLKVMGMLMGMQGGFTKQCCFLCFWNNRDTEKHYQKCDWPIRVGYEPGRSSVKEKPLVQPQRIYLPPLHIKLGLVKNFVKSMGKKNSRGFKYLQKKFPNVSEAKLKEGIFVGPQIRELLGELGFQQVLTPLELNAWLAFKWLCANFLGNNKATEYKEGVYNLIASYKEMGCRM